MYGIIKVNKHTSNHGTWLEDHGYRVEDTTVFDKKKDRDVRAFRVAVDGFVKDLIDLSDLTKGEAQLELASLTTDRPDGEKWALTYSTPVWLPGREKPDKGLFLVGKLGRASALVMKPESTHTRKKSDQGFDW